MPIGGSDLVYRGGINPKPVGDDAARSAVLPRTFTKTSSKRQRQ